MLTDWTCSHAHLRNLVSWWGPCSARCLGPAPTALQLSWVPPWSLASWHLTVLDLHSHVKTYLSYIPIPLTTVLASRLVMANQWLFIRSGFFFFFLDLGFLNCVLKSPEGHPESTFGATIEANEEPGWVSPDPQFGYTHAAPFVYFIYGYLLVNVPLKGLALEKIFGEHFLRLKTCTNEHQNEPIWLPSSNLEDRNGTERQVLPGSRLVHSLPFLELVCSCHSGGTQSKRVSYKSRAWWLRHISSSWPFFFF